MLRLNLTLCLLLLPLSISAETITGVASVTDGDTLEIRGTRIRLHGIDAPESSQRNLTIALDWMHEAFDLIADTGAGRIGGTGYSQLRNDREPDP